MNNDCMVSIEELRAVKRLSTATWDGLLPSERQRVLSLLGTMYRYYNNLATYTAFANGRIERLREALGMALANECGWRDEAQTALAASAPSETVNVQPTGE